jgi:hypothetical protein
MTMVRVVWMITEARMALAVMVLMTGIEYPFQILSRPHDPTRIKVWVCPVWLVTRLVTVCQRCMQELEAFVA